MNPERINIAGGSPWEDIVSYSRAVKMGNLIEVAGTTAMNGSEIMHAGDAYQQTFFILKKIEALLLSVGAKMGDVVRTRIFVTDIQQWELIGKAHGEFFASIKPASTMVEVQRLIHDDLLVEIEVTAIIST